jgi:iron complex outermembrane recepter protein
MRGFGLNQGYRSTVITVDGRRLNNIDLNPQNLSSVPLVNIERIEITKGSGSVVYGDSAMAGTIQIYTRNATKTNITGSTGNYGRTTASINTGASLNKFEISAFADTYEQAGFSDKDPSGKRIEGDRYYYKVKVKYEPTKSSKFFIEKENSGSDIRYQNAMTLGVFDQNPGANTNTSDTPTNYAEALTKSDRINLGGTLKMGSHVKTTLNYFRERRENVTFSPLRYRTDIVNGSITLKKDRIKIITGLERWMGKRIQNIGFGRGTSTKNTIGIFSQGVYDFDDTTISLGVRKEWASYEYNESPESYNLEAFDVGINKSFNKNISVFSNFNYAFQSPNIDSQFNSDGTFNGFLEPATSSTLNIGLNHRTNNNKLKLTVFGSKLRDEIYFNPLSINTNIDKSTKYGIEIQNKHILNKSLSAVINYAYTRAIVDEELRSDLCYVDNCKGNDVPGVSAHNVTFNLHYNHTKNSKFILMQKYRSETFALNDWRNIFTQKQKAYYTTDIAYQYRYKNIDFTARVDNLFERSHGIWISNNNITPYNYTRNWTLGAKIAF